MARGWRGTFTQGSICKDTKPPTPARISPHRGRGFALGYPTFVGAAVATGGAAGAVAAGGALLPGLASALAAGWATGTEAGAGWLTPPFPAAGSGELPPEAG